MTQASIRFANNTISLCGALDFDSVVTINQAGSAFIAANPAAVAITVDLQDVTTTNSAGLALLLEWLRTAKRAQCQLRFTHLPNQLVAMATLCQLETLLTHQTETL